MTDEPHRRYIQVPSLHDYNTELYLSHVRKSYLLATHASLKPLRSCRQSFQLGDRAGHPTLVSTWTRSIPMPTTKTSTTLLNTSKHKAWQPDGRCLWELHHVWGWDNVKD